MSFFSGEVIVEFQADWCQPCASIKVSLDEIEADGVAKILRLNVDEYRDLAIMNKVEYIPTLIRFDKGKEVSRTTGASSKDEILEALGYAGMV